MSAAFFSRRDRAGDLDPAAAAAGAADGSVLLIDVREDDEYRAVRGPGARHIPLGHLGAHLEILAAAGKPVAFVCRSGSRSAMATRLARRAGVDAHNVSGGMLAWERQSLPVERGNPGRG